MIQRQKIDQILNSTESRDVTVVKGWVRTRRDSKTFSFIEINDGSCLKNIQVIADNTLDNYEDVKKITTGSAVSITGQLVASKGKGQRWELVATAVDIVHLTPDDFPLQKKRHGDEYLRSVAHLRPRTNKYGAIFRIRSELSYAIHRFFKEKGFRYIHTPIITASDCEGAGEQFCVTTLPLDNLTLKDGKPDYLHDFFSKE
ncbi:MAG: asparagine--tRNA ligase, partial [Deltaproteobacteria bacterium]|nr:asparagine--tRNA ligase [Deltaproteobacteria bacterium]